MTCACIMCRFGVYSHCVDPAIRALWKQRERVARESLLRFCAGNVSDARAANGQPNHQGEKKMTEAQQIEMAERAIDASQRFHSARAALERALDAVTQAHTDMAAALEEVGVSSRLSGASMIELPDLPEKAAAMADVDRWIKASIDGRAKIGDASMELAEVAIILHETDCASRGEQPFPLRELLSDVKADLDGAK